MIGTARARVARAVRALFDRLEEPPLAATMEHAGDPGLFGPDSVTWRVQRHPAVFVAGPRALLVQACHPEVLAGVVDHSSYRDDPLGRLSRTSAYVTATSFGAVPEVDAAIRAVRRAHRHVRGFSSRGIPYIADDPDLAGWVHNALVDSFLTCYQVFGPGLPEDEADRYVQEQARVGELLGARPLPRRAKDLAAYVAAHPDLDASSDLPDVLRFLRWPPLAPHLVAGYRVLFQAAVATLPERLARITLLRPKPGAIGVGRRFVGFLGWALGDSPAYLAALERATASRSAA